ncbi:unnamed protein product, partial [Diamesa tonsa]
VRLITTWRPKQKNLNSESNTFAILEAKLNKSINAVRLETRKQIDQQMSFAIDTLQQNNEAFKDSIDQKIDHLMETVVNNSSSDRQQSMEDKINKMMVVMESMNTHHYQSQPGTSNALNSATQNRLINDT